MGHRFSSRRHCHYDYHSHCHGRRFHGCDPCCCHKPVLIANSRYLRKLRRRYGFDTPFCQCGGYVSHQTMPPTRPPPPNQIIVPPQYSPIVPYPQVPYPQNPPPANPYQAPRPMPDPNVPMPGFQIPQPQKPVQPRSPSPPPSYYEAIR
uniref:Uncharacterized protein n=1 Tax=Panagrolaimus sp. JU765 TaxID=591449 RepID=A0AC34REQ9_9BILA